jgi:pantoate--beta-alanine ligase
MKTVGTFAQVRGMTSGSVGLVPTMGFFHEGHLSLIEAARVAHDTVVVTLFVNPLQFNKSTDLSGYPRDIERDATLARAAGTDVLFAPDVASMYPSKPSTTVEVAGVADAMEGARRPGHFAGVATVVAKLFAGCLPDSAYFGRKDAQQLAVVRTMAADLSFPVEVRGLPIIRESDGLALSSRNIRIEPRNRPGAVKLSSALFTAADAFEAGERSLDALREITLARLEADQTIDVEYVEIAEAGDASIADRLERDVFIAVAARVGDVRLIDNVLLDPITERADRGIRLEGQSILYGGS